MGVLLDMCLTASEISFPFLVFVPLFVLALLWTSCSQRNYNVTIFQQESTPVAEKEALPGSTSRQDREPDRKPGAHGEWWEGLTDTSRSSAAVRLTVPLFSPYFRFKTWSSLRLKRKSSTGWKLEMNVWKKCTRWAMLNSRVMCHGLCIAGYWWVDCFPHVRWCLLKK